MRDLTHFSLDLFKGHIGKNSRKKRAIHVSLLHQDFTPRGFLV